MGWIGGIARCESTATIISAHTESPDSGFASANAAIGHLSVNDMRISKSDREKLDIWKRCLLGMWTSGAVLARGRHTAAEIFDVGFEAGLKARWTLGLDRKTPKRGKAGR